MSARHQPPGAVGSYYRRYILSLCWLGFVHPLCALRARSVSFCWSPFPGHISFCAETALSHDAVRNRTPFHIYVHTLVPPIFFLRDLDTDRLSTSPAVRLLCCNPQQTALDGPSVCPNSCTATALQNSPTRTPPYAINTPFTAPSFANLGTCHRLVGVLLRLPHSLG